MNQHAVINYFFVSSSKKALGRLGEIWSKETTLERVDLHFSGFRTRKAYDSPTSLKTALSN